MLFLHLWAKEYPAWLIVDDFQFFHSSVEDWTRFCKDLCLWFIENVKENIKIGGVGHTVEIDESILVRRRYNRGRILAQQWVFGGVERRLDGTWNGFIEPVQDRSAATLLEIIERRIERGTRIVLDGWASYSSLNTFGYIHDVVIHEDNFVDPNDPSINTQRVENFWMLLKKFLRVKGTNRAPHNWEYICEFLFRKQFTDVFYTLIDCMRERYVV